MIYLGSHTIIQIHMLLGRLKHFANMVYKLWPGHELQQIIWQKDVFIWLMLTWNLQLINVLPYFC